MSTNHKSRENIIMENSSRYVLPVIGSTWKHYKGNIYIVTGIVIIESNESFSVCCVEKNENTMYPWCRSLSEWYDIISNNQQRFTKIDI